MTPRSRHPADLLAALVDDRLPAADRDLVLAHLAGCPACRAEYESQALVKGVLGRLPAPSAPEALHGRLSGLATPVAGAGWTAPPSDRRGRVGLAGSVLAGVVALGLGVVLVAGSTPTGSAVEPPVSRYVREHAATTRALPVAGSAAEALPAALVLPAGARPSAASSATSAAGRSGRAAVPGSEPRAVALVDAALSAPARVAYAGTLRVALGSGPVTTTAWLEVTHTPGRGTAVSSAATAALYAPTVPATTDRTLGLLARSYRLAVAGADRVAGRPAVVVEARRADGSTAARLWVDTATGLLLRRDTHDQGSVRSSAFERVRLDVPPLRHPPPAATVSLGPVLRSDEGDDPTTVCGPCPGELAGLVRYDARRVRIGSGAGVHLSYSDGLSTVSVFAQPGRLDPPRAAGLEPATLGGWPVWARAGLPDQVVWSAAGTVYTVVSDAPAGTLEDVVAALPHEPDPAPLLLRLERGASRVISWLDPSR